MLGNRLRALKCGNRGLWLLVSEPNCFYKKTNKKKNRMRLHMNTEYPYITITDMLWELHGKIEAVSCHSDEVQGWLTYSM